MEIKPNQEQSLRNAAMKIHGLAGDIRSRQEMQEGAEPPILDYWATCLYELEEKIREDFML